MATEKTPPKRTPMRFKHKLLLIIVSLLAMAFLRTGFLFLLIGLMPSIIAYYMDVSTGRYLFKTVYACNLTGMLPYLYRMVQHGPSSAALQQVMGSAETWTIVLGSALLGVLLVKICPAVAKFTVSGITQTQILHIENVQKRIEAEWGPEAAQFSQAAQAEEEAYEG